MAIYLKVYKIDHSSKSITVSYEEVGEVEFTELKTVELPEEIWAREVQLVSLNELFGFSEPLTLEELKKRYPKDET
jgi:hypothetical protein